MLDDKNVNLIWLNVHTSVGNHLLHGGKRESLVRGTWAQTQTASSLSHHPRSSRHPHESHRCIQGLGHECMLIKPGAKFPFWPGFNQDGFGVFAVVLLLLLFLFFFWLHLHSLEQRTHYPACWTQKSCITYFQHWSLCGKCGFSNTQLAPEIFGIVGHGAPALSWLPCLCFVISVH